MKINKILHTYLLTAFFFAFNGYYVVLILLSNLSDSSLSRNLTLPIRILILICLFLFFRKRISWHRNKGVFVFLIFCVLYSFRILVEASSFSSYHLSELEFFLYFISFVVAPFFLLAYTNFFQYEYEKVFKIVLFSGLIFSLLTYYFYESFVGDVGRLSHQVGRDDNYISPLVLSYCSTLVIGIGITYLLTNFTTKKEKLYIIICIITSFVPFFLGASRGSILALLLPFIFYLLFKEGIRYRMQALLGLSLLGIGFVFASETFGTGVFDRFLSITEGIESQSSSSVRLIIWKSSIDQFLENPLFGNSLEANLVKHYPHNILIEVLITTGILGFIPFIIFLAALFKKSREILKKHPHSFWIVVILIQAFTQNMFSGSIYSASWFAISAGLVVGYRFKD